MKSFIAIRTGFYGKRRTRGGGPFAAPNDFEASWAKEVSPEGVDLDGDEPGFLDRSVPAIVGDLSKLTDAALRQAQDAETAGKTRSSLIAAIEDEIANRAGAIDDKDDKDDLAEVKTHKEIDDIATAEDITFDGGTTTVVDKIAAVRAARQDEALLA